MPASPAITAFSPLNPPWSLTALDANFTAIQALLASINNYTTWLTDTGVANAYAVATPAGTTFTLTAGVSLFFKAANGNTAASTLSVNAGPATNIVRNNGQSVSSGDIPTGGTVQVVYDGTNWVLEGHYAPQSLNGFFVNQYYPWF